MDGLEFMVRIGFPDADVAKVDVLLAAKDQPLFSDLRERWSRDYRRIVRAGKVRKKEEEALLTQILASKRIHHAERDDLNRMLTEYEKTA